MPKVKTDEFLFLLIKKHAMPNQQSQKEPQGTLEY